jgi:hypothetical protein
VLGVQRGYAAEIPNDLRQISLG